MRFFCKQFRKSSESCALWQCSSYYTGCVWGYILPLKRFSPLFQIWSSKHAKSHVCVRPLEPVWRFLPLKSGRKKSGPTAISRAKTDKFVLIVHSNSPNVFLEKKKWAHDDFLRARKQTNLNFYLVFKLLNRHFGRISFKKWAHDTRK